MVLKLVMIRMAMTYKCLSCHWCKTIPKCSDALVDGVSAFSRCPNCDSILVDEKKANIINSVIANIILKIKS